MSTKKFAFILVTLGVMIFAGCAATANNFKTVGDRLSWFLTASASLLLLTRFMFFVFSYGLPGSRK